MILPDLIIAPSGKKGRGVFAGKTIEKNTVIEISPVIVLDKKDRNLIEKTKLNNYIFEWGDKRKKACIALGYVSLYNHSYSSNCEYEMDFESKTIKITTVKKVMIGEELTINYNAEPDNKTPIWFEVT
jgi:SET domain-containing protein